jgi:hypothetical protein
MRLGPRRAGLCFSLLGIVVVSVMFTLFVGPSAAATPAVGVTIQAEHLTGLRPDGSTVVIRTKVVVEGADASSLVGDGRHFGSGGFHGYYPMTGSIDGNVVTVAGVVADGNNPDYLGSPVEIEADIASGVMTLTFGPLTGGPFAGGTVVVHGVGRVSITTSGK